MDSTVFFQTGMPGVKAATFAPKGGTAAPVNVQWFADVDEFADLEMRGNHRRYQAKGLTTEIGDAHRGDILTLEGHDYTITDALADGHGVTMLDLDP